MKLTRLIAGIALAALAFAAPASANVIVMCAPDVAGGTQGPRTIGGTTSAVPSGTVYIVNGQGCAVVQAGDVGYFQSQGFVQGENSGSIQLVIPTTATGTTSFQIGTLPASTAIRTIYASNTDATHAVTGSIAIGTTSGGTDVAAATSLTSGTNSTTWVTDALTLKRSFSTTAGQALFATAGTSWNTPTTVTITVTYEYF